MFLGAMSSCRRGFCCCFGGIILIIGVLLFFGFVMAKSGTVAVPWLSKHVYQVPMPTRLVAPNQVENLQQRVIEGFNLQDQTASIYLTESELTWYLAKELSQQSDPYFAENVQAVVTEQFIEFYGTLLRPLTATITAELQPGIENESLTISIKQVKVGNLTVPQFLQNYLASRIETTLEQSLNGLISSNVKVKSLNLTEGRLNIIIASGSASEKTIDF